MSETTIKKTNSVGHLLATSASQLHESGSPALDAELLLAYVLNKSRSWLRAFDDYCPDENESARFAELLDQRKNGIPIAHLLGQREFWSLPLRVNADTLIPRADTELLVQQALKHLPDEKKTRVLELGTGTGAIALALASERPQTPITATDISSAALALAKTNAQSLGMTQVQFVESDWFSALPTEKFSLIVSNPPYIAEGDPHLEQDDVRFEPRQALVAGTDGLAALRIIIANAPDYLAPDGWLLVEHGYTQALAVQNLFAAAGFIQINNQRDLGEQPRVTKGQLPGS